MVFFLAMCSVYEIPEDELHYEYAYNHNRLAHDRSDSELQKLVPFRYRVRDISKSISVWQNDLLTPVPGGSRKLFFIFWLKLDIVLNGVMKF